MDPAAIDFSEFNWFAFGLAIFANIVIGFFWYSPKTPTGKTWMRGVGHDMSTKPPAGEMVKSMVLMIIGVGLFMFVFMHTNMIYEDAFRNTATGGTTGYNLSLMDGLMGGFFTWLGFIVPIQLNTVAFDRKPWSLYFVNVGYYLVVLLVAGTLVALV